MYGPVHGDEPGLGEKPEGQLGEQLGEGGGPLHDADGVRAVPDLGKEAAPDPGAQSLA